jgi:hypothetical protein
MRYCNRAQGLMQSTKGLEQFLETRKASVNGQSPSITKKKKGSILQQSNQLESLKKRKRSTSKKPMTEAKKKRVTKKSQESVHRGDSEFMLPLNNQMLNSDYKLVLKLRPLVDGMVFYKKFSVRQSLTTHSKTFDPLQADLVPPEMCGYGLRVL